jgi:flagellar basal-body rod protein FlgF
MRARMESLDLLANNMANAATGGYKADREFYGLYVGEEAADTETATTMPLIERPWVDHTQGTLQATGNPLDVALSGQGFIAVNGPSGPLYTRNGSFRMAADGRLLTSDGFAVRNASATTPGGSFALQPGASIEIAGDGTIKQNGVVTGQLEIVDFTSRAGLVKQGSSYFRASDPNLARSPSTATVAQGQVEAANTGPAEGAVRLVSVMRQFEMLQKAITLGSDMSKKVIEEVAKV